MCSDSARPELCKTSPFARTKHAVVSVKQMLEKCVCVITWLRVCATIFGKTRKCPCAVADGDDDRWATSPLYIQVVWAALATELAALSYDS